MKYLLILMSVYLVGCNGADITEGIGNGTGASSGDDNAPRRWPTSAFPLQIKMANDFTDQEKVSIEELAAQWTAVGEEDLQFFTTSFPDFDGSQSTNIDSYKDGQFGIYRSNGWLEGIEDNVLAVTISYGYRYNTGSPNEYVEYNHGDIIVNYRDFIFSLDPDQGEFDFESVVLHELGHFVGLTHYYNWFENSVMKPSILPQETLRELQDIDEQNLRDNYLLSANVSAMIDGAAALSTEPDYVQIISYLKADGECEHYENGVRKGSHFSFTTFSH